MASEPDRKTVRVSIFNQTYSLGATGEPGEVEALAHTVDELMTSVAQRAGNMDAQRIAVLACLHMADKLRTKEHELASLKERVDHKTRELTILLDQAID